MAWGSLRFLLTWDGSDSFILHFLDCAVVQDAPGFSLPQESYLNSITKYVKHVSNENNKRKSLKSKVKSMCSSRAAEGKVSSQPQWQLDWSAAEVSSKAQMCSCYQSLPRVIPITSCLSQPKQKILLLLPGPWVRKKQHTKEEPFEEKGGSIL